jgi:uncharacterized phosphosugar-binding protein
MGNMKPSTAASYIDIVRERFDSLRTQEKRIREAAALIVDRVLDKGTLWIYDREEALSWEANVKAAGLLLTDHRLTPESEMKSGDVLLIGAVETDTPEDLDLARRAKNEGASVIVLAAASVSGCPQRGKLLAKEADIAIDNRSPEASGVLSAKGIAHTFCPAAGVMNDFIFWALCAAVADELLARGKTPTVYRGVHLFAGREYNTRAAERFKELGY